MIDSAIFLQLPSDRACDPLGGHRKAPFLTPAWELLGRPRPSLIGRESTMRIAYFGGSFNPPHYGHFLAASWALCSGEVDRVWMTPCYQHAFGKQLVPFEDRVEMCKRGAALLSPKIEISTVEAQFDGPSYTIDVIEALCQQHPDHQFRLLVGTDILAERHQWKSFERLASLAPLLIAPRGGYDHQNPFGFHIPEVSSSAVRQCLASPDSDDAAQLIPPAILDYIQTHQLFLVE